MALCSEAIVMSLPDYRPCMQGIVCGPMVKRPTPLRRFSVKPGPIAVDATFWTSGPGAGGSTTPDCSG